MSARLTWGTPAIIQLLTVVLSDREQKALWELRMWLSTEMINPVNLKSGATWAGLFSLMCCGHLLWTTLPQKSTEMANNHKSELGSKKNSPHTAQYHLNSTPRWQPNIIHNIIPQHFNLVQWQAAEMMLINVLRLTTVIKQDWIVLTHSFLRRQQWP